MRTRIALVAVMLVAGACGDSGAEPAGVAGESATADVTTTLAPTTSVAPATSAAPTTIAPTSTTTTTDAPPEPIEVRAVDYGFEGLPASVPVGTMLTLVNESEMELHELVAIRLPDDESRSVDELVQLPPDELASFFPMVETVIIAPPGESGFPIEGIGMLKKPGRYLVICAIPIGADPDEYMAAAAQSQGGPPDVAGGPPHLAAGMYGEVIVEG